MKTDIFPQILNQFKKEYQEYEVVFKEKTRPSLVGRNFKTSMGYDGPAASMDCVDKCGYQFSPQMYLTEIEAVYKLKGGTK